MVGDIRQRLLRCWEVAVHNSEQARDKAKTWYDKRARHREFHPGDEVLLLLPIQGQPLHAKFSGPYKVIKKISSTNYIISTPDRRRSQRLCHINTLKQYHSREPPDTPPDSSVLVCAADVCLVDNQHEEEEVSPITLSSVKTWQSNSATMQEKLEHLQQPQKTEVLDLLYKYPSVFKNEPGRTTAVAHDIDVGSASPIKQAPYRVHPSRVNQMMSELADIESLGVIEPSQAPHHTLHRATLHTLCCSRYHSLSSTSDHHDCTLHSTTPPTRYFYINIVHYFLPVLYSVRYISSVLLPPPLIT
ncbi:hypothetical protein Pcinc_010851 [Petrolisthes cinctipes]|uniref:Integrase p58-like C-terminal domain-containing protein n=1 Tax=Petrolisthes cinctipes TaxID=88211 RepID=A0AAE1G3Y5_PETCI|nr:hypothetical protein Pcinc_010851 [Petrolisthes cinctipes]